jgi:transposase-like protein
MTNPLALFAPQCPACRSEATHHEQGDRHQCDRCKWRFVVLPNGSTRDWLKIGRAGRAKSKRSQ